MSDFKFLLPTVLLMVSVSVMHADIINVPGDYDTIQAGINAADEGDTVLVADGTYTGDGNRDIDFLGKAIVVMSENGPESCIIDCEGSYQDQHRGFYFHNGEEASSIVLGFTITNGYQEYGGGIGCEVSSPTITGNIITGNMASIFGGGITVANNSSPIITGNTITGNVALATDGAGGGITSWGFSTPTITDNTISQNTADWGGGIYCVEVSTIITDNEISENVAMSGPGGGLMTAYADAEIRSNTITGNVTNESGWAGLSCWWGTSIIEDNVISGNTAAGRGAGISLLHDNSTISNNIITDNAAVVGGGGIRVSYSSATMSHNTIAENTTAGDGGGIWVGDSSAVNITNTISWNNTATTGEEIALGYNASFIPSILTISYSDVEGGEEEVFVDEGCTINWGYGMIDADPMFVLPDKRDYRLLWESPCIDTGDPIMSDADGTRCDMGAHFFDQDDYLTLYITPDMTEVAPGEVLGVTYTAINRWEDPVPFWVLSQVLLPGGSAFNVLGPDQYTLPANYTAQVHRTHPVPGATPTGNRCAATGAL
jgi:parallel beta-helix repeat protein